MKHDSWALDGAMRDAVILEVRVVLNCGRPAPRHAAVYHPSDRLLIPQRVIAPSRIASVNTVRRSGSLVEARGLASGVRVA
jgi:hypothetical protein